MITVSHARKAFGEFRALDDVSLDIRSGEFFSLLGPSGCGKTTLLRIIGGFDHASEGEVRIHGKSVLGEPPYLRRTNMIFQHLALFPHMNVFENVSFGLEMKGVPKAERRTRVEQMLRGVRATEQAFLDAADAELADARPLLGNAFKVRLARNTIVRTLLDLVELPR